LQWGCYEMIRSKLKDILIELKWKLVGVFGKLLIDAIFCTSRIESAGFETIQDILKTRKFIVAAWHSRILLVSYLYKGYDGAILVSRSDDGEIIARVLQRQGHETVRGSSSRGGLRAISILIRKLKEKARPGVIIPDGPQGPRNVVQPGIIMLAKKTGYPIIPVTYSAERMKVFSSWDRFILPRPFTKCRMIYGDPVYVPADADPNGEEESRVRLEAEMNKITNEADDYFGHRII